MEITTTIPVMSEIFNVQAQEWIDTAKRLYKLQKEIKQLEADEKLVMEQLKHLSNNSSARGDIFLFMKTLRKGNVNYKDIPELSGVDLERYRGKSVENWKLSLDIPVEQL